MRRSRVVLAAACLFIVAGSAHAQRVDGARPRSSDRTYGRAPDVEVWIDRYVFRSGERIRAYFESEPGAYVTILRVSTLGNVTVLYPRRPTAQSEYRDRLANDEVPYGGRREFYLNEPEGVGYIFAVASFERFDYRAFSSGGQWSMTRLAGYGYGDPYRAVNNFVSRTLSPRADYSTDYIQYEIIGTGRHDRYGYDYGYGYGYATRDTWYNDQYFRCLNYYGMQAVGYCHSYAGSGIGGLPFIVLRPRQPAAPTTPTSARVRKMAPPGRLIPDPGVAKATATSPASSSSRYSEARQRASSPRVMDNGDELRVERRQRPERERYEPAPYVIALPRHEPPPVQHYEAPRVEPRQEPRPQPVAREHPARRVEPVPPPPPPPAK